MMRNTERACFELEVVVIREGFFEDLKNDLENLENLEKMEGGQKGHLHEGLWAEESFKF